MKKLFLAFVIILLFTSCANFLLINENYQVDHSVEQTCHVEYHPVYHNCKVMNCPMSGKIVGYKSVVVWEKHIIDK